MKRKVAGMFFLFCLLAPIATTCVFLEFQRNQVKREVKRQMIAGIDKQELVLFKFTEAISKKELNWEHSKEFEYKGEMYDVIDKQIKGDTIHFWCWWDHEETKLNKQLDVLLAKILGKNPQRQGKKSQLAHFFKMLFHELHDDQLELSPFYKIEHFCFSEDFTSIYYSPPVPPPRLS